MRRVHGPSIARSAFCAFCAFCAFPALFALLPACDGCHGGKPYTPYTLADTPSAAPSAGAGSAADAGFGDAGPAFAVVAAAPAPGDGTRWPLQGGAVEAPPGHVFAQGLVLDVDGDGKPDLLAWSRGPDGLRGELWFAPGSNPAGGRIVAALPADLAAAGCNAVATLSQIGPGAALFDFAPRCPARLRERAARWIAVVRLAATPEIGLELRLGAPADGESLQVAVDGRDRDGDGRGDVTITVTLTGAARPLPPGGSAAAALAFFDRPAGLSRDPGEPEASFKALGASLIADGRKKTTSPRIPAAALAARRLQALLCDDGGGKPIIITTAGPTRCGELRLVEDSTIAEIEASLNLGDPVAAFAALARLDALAPRRKDVDALVARSVPSITGHRLRTTAASPYVQAAPTWSPIAFDAGGDLLVRTRDRVVRVDRASFEEVPADAGIKWPNRLVWPTSEAPSWTLTAIEERCDAPSLVGRFDLGGEVTDILLPIATAPRCTAGGRLPIDVLGTSAQGVLLAVRGDVVALPAQTPPRPALADSFALAAGAPVELGAARSPDGAVIALPTSRGVLVAALKGQGRGATAKLWTAPAGDGTSSCVPSNRGERLACVVEKGVAIYDAK